MTTTTTGRAGALVKTLFTVAFISAVAAGAGYALMRQDISRARDEASANAVTSVNHVLAPAVRGSLDPDKARSAADALRSGVVGHTGISRVRLYDGAGILLASTDPSDRSDVKTPVANALGVARSGEKSSVVASGRAFSAVGGDATLATFERARQGRGGVVVAEIDQRLGPIDATGERRWRDPTRESEIAAVLFLVLGFLGLLALRARAAIRGRAKPATRLAPVASFPSALKAIGKTDSTPQHADVPEEASAPPRARRASDGHVQRLQTELKGRDDELRRMSDEMASLARDAQARIAELEDQLSRGPTVSAPVAMIGRASAEVERARAAAEQRAAQAESRAEAAEAAAAQAESRLRESQASADALRVELQTVSSAASEGRAPSLRDRLAEAAATKDDPSEHRAG